MIATMEWKLVNQDQTSTDSLCPSPLVGQRLDAIDANQYLSTMPVPTDALLGASWRGTTPAQLVMNKDKPLVMATTWPSVKSAGHVHYEVVWLPTGASTYSKRAFHPAMVGFALDMLLKPHGLTAADLKWAQTDELAPDAS